jgi:hypothetical protein
VAKSASAPPEVVVPAAYELAKWEVTTLARATIETGRCPTRP